MSKYRKMLISLGVVVLLSTLTISGSLAQGPQDLKVLAEGVYGGTQPIDMSEVPMIVQHAAIAAVSNIKATDAGVEIAKDGTLLYVLNFQDEEGREISVDVAHTGSIVAAEYTLAMEELPREIAATVERWAPYLEAPVIEKSVRPDAVVFELTGTDAQGNRIYAEIPAGGLSITITFDQEAISATP